MPKKTLQFRKSKQCYLVTTNKLDGLIQVSQFREPGACAFHLDVAHNIPLKSKHETIEVTFCFLHVFTYGAGRKSGNKLTEKARLSEIEPAGQHQASQDLAVAVQQPDS